MTEATVSFTSGVMAYTRTPTRLDSYTPHVGTKPELDEFIASIQGIPNFTVEYESDEQRRQLIRERVESHLTGNAIKHVGLRPSEPGGDDWQGSSYDFVHPYHSNRNQVVLADRGSGRCYQAYVKVLLIVA